MNRGSIRIGFEQWYARIAAKPFRGAWQGIAIVSFGTALVAGCLMRVTDPTRYHSVWVGMWWGLETVTTVGYGDVVPGTVAGRLTAVAVMLVGISFITVTAAAITSEFVEAARRRRQQQPDSEAVTALSELRYLRDQVATLQDSLEELRRDLRAGGAS
jgi:hypothetical protein